MLWRSLGRTGAMLWRSLGRTGAMLWRSCGRNGHFVEVVRPGAGIMLQRGFRLLGAAVGDLRLVTALPRRQYRSVYSLDRLYPDSGGAARSQDQEPSSNPSSIDIPIDRLAVTYSRSSGPGGQNVNKVNTKAEVRFHVATADWLSTDVRNVITAKYPNRINRAGQLIVTSEVSRYQMRNLADCLQKIRDMVTAASETPKQPSKESAEIRRMRVETMHRERLRQKKIQSSIKQDRRVTID